MLNLNKFKIAHNCNVSFCLEMDSDYVISKSEDHLAPPFLQFCKKYDICNLSQGALTGAFGKLFGIEHIPFKKLEDY